MPASALILEADAALQRFRRFYGELATVKRLLSKEDWVSLLGGRAPDPAVKDEAILHAVRLRLRNAIAAQGFGAPTHGNGRIDAGYVMAAIADEELLHGMTGWAGYGSWREVPLEAVLYRSRIAGDRIFVTAEALTKPDAQDPHELAMTILLALEMGFRGRYYAGDPHGEIPRIKENLLRLLFYNQDPTTLEFDNLITGAPEPMTRRQPDRLPRVRPWGLAIGAVVVAYLLISWVIWRNQVSNVLDSARAAMQAVETLRNSQSAQ